MQAQIAKGSLLGELHTKTVTTTVKEITPFGLRTLQNTVGDFTGTYTAHHTATREMFLKNDGSFNWSSKFFQNTKDGDIIYGSAHGTGKMTGPTMSKGEGEVIFMTESPRLSWLNMLKGRVESSGDSATGETHFKTFVL
ncbi:MAG: hypothetical protein M1587_05855 [Thaumarchaeota archaeon]|nr:hypothetical protein [Nitrososphaerota archaeon]